MTGPNSPGIPFLMNAARGLSVPCMRPNAQQMRRPEIRMVAVARPRRAPRGTALRPVMVVRSEALAPPLAPRAALAAGRARPRRAPRPAARERERRGGESRGEQEADEDPLPGRRPAYGMMCAVTGFAGHAVAPSLVYVIVPVVAPNEVLPLKNCTV